MAKTSASQFHQCVTYVKLETVVIILKLRTLLRNNQYDNR